MTVHPVRAELYLGGQWVDVSQRLRRRSPVVVRRGRPDELSAATPSTLDLWLSNNDGALTPRDPRSPWYPDFGRGTPCRVWVDGGGTALILPGVTGSYASTPDHSSLDITGTITVLAWVDPEAWVNVTGTAQRIASKWRDSTNDRSWSLGITVNGNLTWEWSADGSTVAGTHTSSDLVAAQRPQWVGVEFTPNNGAGSKVTRYLMSDDGVTWDVLSTSTLAGTTSIFSGAAPVEVGSRNAGTGSFRGRVLAGRVLNGNLSAGTIATSPDFTARAPGTTSFTDAQGRVWTVHGTAEVATRTIRGVGQVDEAQIDWPQATPRNHGAPGVAHVAVKASGMLRRMGQGAKPLASTLHRFLASPSAAGSVLAYWPLEDGSDATVSASPISGVTPMRLAGAWRRAADDSLHASAPLPSISGSGAWGYTGRVPQGALSDNWRHWRVDMFVRIDTPATGTGTRLCVLTVSGSTIYRWAWGVSDTTVTLTGRDQDDNLIVNASTSTDPAFFGTWAIWSLELQQNGGNVDYDLSIVPLPAGVAYGLSGSTAAAVGRPDYVLNTTPGAPPDGLSMGHIVVSESTELGWLAGADTAWLDETAAHRFRRLCREENIPCHIIGDPTVAKTFRGDPAYSPRMGPQRQATLVDLLRECAEVDQGVMSEHRTAPALDLRLARTLTNQAPAVTFDTSAGAVGRDFTPVDDDQRTRNDVTATRPDGASARAIADPAPASGDLYDTEVEVNVASDNQLPDQAGWRLHLGTWPAMRYPNLNTSIRKAGPGVAKAWADLALGDRVTLDNLPRQHDKTVDLLVEGYTETLDLFDWAASVDASPAGPWEVGVRDDDDRGKRDTAGTELFVASLPTDTDIAVTVTSGPAWTLDAAEFPIMLDVGGEQVRANGSVIFGAYVFTGCDRSLNGVVKTHPIGTPVRLWRPTIRSLAGGHVA